MMSMEPNMLIHPGVLLKEEFIDPDGLSESDLVRAFKLPLDQVASFIEGRSNVTPELANRISLVFGMSAKFWTNLQARYDSDRANVAG